MHISKKIYIYIFIILFLNAIPLFLFPRDRYFDTRLAAYTSYPRDLEAPDLNSIVVDGEGNVFAFAGETNGSRCFIIKFDPYLDYVTHFGSEGRGPGQFTTRQTSPEGRLSIDSNGDVYVVDHNPTRLVVFDNNGKHKKDIPFDQTYSKSIGRVYRIRVSGDGSLTALKYRSKTPPYGLIFRLDPTKVKVRYPFLEKPIYGNFTSGFYGRNCIIDTDSNHIVFGDSQIYKFRVYDNKGKLILAVEDKDRWAGQFKRREMRYIKRNFLQPKRRYSRIKNKILVQLNEDRERFEKVVESIRYSKNIISDIKISSGRVWVFLVRKNITRDGKYPCEIYNLRGEMIDRGYFRKKPVKIWKDYAFYYDKDEDDYPLILKYRVFEPYR
ncbi:MAG: hypothetical protein GY940_23925 [bacterium]|nr:hypothetical protein [bacterium]